MKKPTTLVDQLSDLLLQLNAAAIDARACYGYKHIAQPVRQRLEAASQQASAMLTALGEPQRKPRKSAPLIEVIQRANGSEGLGGDIGGMTRLLARQLKVGRRRARQLLSDACERLELACDGEGLERVTSADVIDAARQVLQGDQPKPWHGGRRKQPGT